jgi:dihydrofolate synthase/folylpolyglutamate synthase
MTALGDWLARLETRHHKPIDLGLERVAAVRDRLGSVPQCPVILVGGTNGKGSVSAYLHTTLSMAGYRAGLYTSPHLLHFNERIRIAGQLADDASLVEAMEAVEAARQSTPLTYFEHTTLAALWLFQRAHLDVLILEVGLGGRLDAVNIVEPDCAVVTSVDLDHQAYLGDDREQIGREKAGIYRAGKPAICTDPNPPQSLLARARDLPARLLRLGVDIELRVQGAVWECRVAEGVFTALPMPALRGRHQLNNAAAAIAALWSLRERLPVPVSALRAGLASTTLPGRFQVVGQAPLRILDVAHNPHAARALAACLADIPPTGRIVAVFGMLADKDIEAVVALLQPYIGFWHVAPLNGPRAAGPERLALAMAAAACSYRMHDDIAEAWRAACQEAGPADTIIAFGSFHTVAEIMAAPENNG